MKIANILSTLPAVIATVFLVTATSPAAAAEKTDFNVTLLGTGTPPPLMARFGPATLIRVNGRTLMFDAGRGSTQRLWQIKVALGKVDQLFLTHLHSDHVVGIPDLMLTGWLASPFGRRKGQFNVVGPKGTKNLMANIRQAYDWDIQTRMNDQGFKETGVIPNVAEIHDGFVWNEDDIKVTAFKVNHGDKIDPAFGYRIEFDGRSVVISGDTKPTNNLVKNAMDADLFIHSVAAIKQELRDSAKHWNVIMAHHSEPEDAGRTFAQTNPKMATYSHIVLLTNGKIKPPSFDDLTTRTRTQYDGPFVVGKDLMSFDIGKDGVTVNPPPGQ